MGTDVISICLGVISAILAVYSVWQSWRYKNLGDKLDKDKEQIIKTIKNNSTYSAISIRHLSENLYSEPNTINLHKDELHIFKNSNYKSCKADEVIQNLNKELPKVLKQTYIDSIMATLNLDDETSTEVGIVTLRRQYEVSDLEKIKRLNDIFYEYGISFEIKIS